MASNLCLNKVAFEANPGIKFLMTFTADIPSPASIGGWQDMNSGCMPERHSPPGYFLVSPGPHVPTVLMAVRPNKRRWF